MANDAWHYSTSDDHQDGPVSSSELNRLAAAGELRPDDLVWSEGMDAWLPASRVKGLTFRHSSPPPSSGSIRAECSHCGQPYKVTADKLGKTTTCKKCGERFVIDATVDTSIAATTGGENASSEEPQGWWSKVKAAGRRAVAAAQEATEEVAKKAAEEAARKEAEGGDGRPPRHEMIGTRFVTGPYDIKPGTSLSVYVRDGELVALAQQGFQDVEAFRVPVTAVKKTDIDTAKRMTVGRVGAGLLLLGPLGAVIGGWGFKKNDKFLRIDYDDGGTEQSIVIGPGRVEEINNKLLAARRAALASRDAES